jgi:hypothetical protein
MALTFGEIKRAIEELKTSLEWQENWDEFIDNMVYNQKKPTYQQAIANLEAKSNLALNQIRNLQ